MKNVQNLKTATIILFLIIVFPGKIAFINIIAIFLSILNFILMIGVEPINLDFIVSLITIISLFLFFSKNKFYSLFAIFALIFYIFFTFNIEFFNYWYYTIPVISFIIFSLSLANSIINFENNKLIDKLVSNFYVKIIFILFTIFFLIYYVLRL